MEEGVQRTEKVKSNLPPGSIFWGFSEVRFTWMICTWKQSVFFLANASHAKAICIQNACHCPSRCLKQRKLLLRMQHNGKNLRDILCCRCSQCRSFCESRCDPGFLCLLQEEDPQTPTQASHPQTAHTCEALFLEVLRTILEFLH